MCAPLPHPVCCLVHPRVCACALQAELGVATVPGEVHVPPGCEWVRVSLDRTTLRGVVVECKSVLAPPHGAAFPAAPPLAYTLQCGIQMAVTGAPAALLAMAYVDAPEWEREVEAANAAAAAAAGGWVSRTPNWQGVSVRV